MRRLIDTLFPAGDPQRKKKTSELVALGLRALRDARDARAVATGNATLVPSRLELRMSQGRYDELMEIGATRDVEYYFNDEMMKDLAGGRMRTFGEHPVFVTIAADASLQPNEIYAAVLSPAREEDRPAVGSGAEPYDRTGVLGDEEELPAPPPPRRTGYRLLLRGSANASVRLEGGRWILGRRGASGRLLPHGYVKVDLDLAPHVSREQARVDLIGGDRLRIERVGKAPMRLASGETIAEGESRLVPIGTPFYIDDCELLVTATDAA